MLQHGYNKNINLITLPLWNEEANSIQHGDQDFHQKRRTSSLQFFQGQNQKSDCVLY